MLSGLYHVSLSINVIKIEIIASQRGMEVDIWWGWDFNNSFMHFEDLVINELLCVKIALLIPTAYASVLL